MLVPHGQQRQSEMGRCSTAGDYVHFLIGEKMDQQSLKIFQFLSCPGPLSWIRVVLPYLSIQSTFSSQTYKFPGLRPSEDV